MTESLWASAKPLLLAAPFATAFVALAALYAGLGVYSGTSEPMLRALDRSVGETLMREAQAIDAAGLETEAIKHYRKALAARFAGPQNRRRVQHDLGKLLWDRGEEAEALELFLDAVATDEPDAAFFPALAQALLERGQLAACNEAVALWRSRASMQASPALLSDAICYEGLLALREGDEGAAYDAFREAVGLYPRGRATAELGLFVLARGQREAAQTLLESYLASGAAGGQGDRAREALAGIYAGAEQAR